MATGRPEASLEELLALLTRLHQRLVTGARQAPGVAASFVRRYIPAKFQFLEKAPGSGPRGPRLWVSERRLLGELGRASARAGRPAHSHCVHSWLVASLADCAQHLGSALEAAGVRRLGLAGFRDYLPAHPDVGGCEGALGDSWDVFSESSLQWADSGSAVAPLESSECVPADVAFDTACGLSRILEASRATSAVVVQEKLRRAAAFFDDAALRLLLCDGCRYDGRGLSVVPLDQILWTIGFLHSRLTQESGVPLLESYAEAQTAFRSHPRMWWRGAGDDRELYGRPRHCPAAMRDMCAGWGRLWMHSSEETPGAEASAVLPSCQLDHEVEDHSSVSLLDPGAAASCAWRPPTVVGLFLPVNVGATNSLNHLTMALTWLLPALAWSYGGNSTERLLGALWRRGGLPGPPPRSLDAHSTEAILVPHHGAERLPGKVVSPSQSLVRELFPLLSRLPVRSLEEGELSVGCTCFAAALWGYVDPSLRMHGDFGRGFTARLRTALGAFTRPASPSPGRGFAAGLLREAARAGLRVRPARAPPAGEGTLRPAPVRAIFAQRARSLQPVLRRNLTNRVELSLALAALAGGEPPLELVDGPLERLPVATQLQLALETEVMVQPFGAGLAWSTLLAAGSYVVELQEDGVATSHFVSCFSPWDKPGALPGAPAAETNLWWPASNPRSEWGAWAFVNGVNFACASSRPTPARCMRSFNPTAWDTPTITADVELVVRLVSDAAHRLRTL